MSRFVAAAVLVPLAAALVSAAPAPAPVKPADAALPVPAKSLVVVQVSGAQKARDRLHALLKAAVPDLADGLRAKIDAALADAPGLRGRDLAAVTPDARLYLVVTEFEAGPDGPPMAFLIPVKDYATFKDKLLTADERKTFEKGKGGIDAFDSQDKTLYAVELAGKGYVAVGPSKAAVEPFAARYEALTPATMGGGVGEAFLTADAAVFVNLDRINELFGDKIKQGRQLFQLVLQQGAAGGAGLDKRQLEMIKDVYEVLFQGVEDARGFAFGIEFRPTGLNLRYEASFAADTPTAKRFAQEAPTPAAGVATLPAGLATYTGNRFGPKLAAAMIAMGREYGAEDGDDKTAALIDKYNDLTAEAFAAGVIQAADLGGASLTAAAAKDAAAMVDAELAVVQALKAGGVFRNVPLKEKPAVKPAARKVAGYTLHEASFALDFDAAVKHIADENLRNTTIASMKRFLPDTPTLWFGTDGKAAVEVLAKDWPTAEKLLKEYAAGKPAVGASAAFKAARSELPADVGMLTLMDVGRLLATLSDSLGDVAGTIPGLPIGKLPKLTPPSGDPAFVGVSVVLKPTTARLDIFVPAGAAKVVRGAIEPLLAPKAE